MKDETGVNGNDAIETTTITTTSTTTTPAVPSHYNRDTPKPRAARLLMSAITQSVTSTRSAPRHLYDKPLPPDPPSPSPAASARSDTSTSSSTMVLTYQYPNRTVLHKRAPARGEVREEEYSG